MSVDIKAIRWLLDNATAYAISKNCSVSIQAVDKYKNGVSDIINMWLKHAINIIDYARTLQENRGALFLLSEKSVQVKKNTPHLSIKRGGNNFKQLSSISQTQKPQS